MTFRNKKDYIKYLKNREVSIDDKKRWSNEYLTKELGKKFQIIRPRFPRSEDSKYEEWKIHFERFFLVNDNIILIGGSLEGYIPCKIPFRK